jgi:hypothetical protein
MTDIPLCIHCKHYTLFSDCIRPLNDRRSLVSGELLYRAEDFASNERLPGRKWFGLGRERCGPEGKFWEGKT